VRLGRDRATRGAASTFHSHLGPKKGKPAGIAPPANQRRNEIIGHLIFLPLIVVTLEVKVKVIRNIIVGSTRYVRFR
jgi:hypothetical protein